MFCPKCGVRLSENMRFCPSCGAATTVGNVSQPPIPKKKRRWVVPTVVGGIVVLIVVGGVALVSGMSFVADQAHSGISLTWSAPNTLDGKSEENLTLMQFDEVSTCAETCHTPMDPYVQTFNQSLGESGTDKWGNAVADTSSMLCLSHKESGFDCLSCHQLTEDEKRQLLTDWNTGNYVNPLDEYDADQLTKARGIEGDAFCLNESCHNLSRADLIQATSNTTINPHDEQHGEMSCGECHKSHRASVNYCTQCHTEAEVPAGWLSVNEASKLDFP